MFVPCPKIPTLPLTRSLYADDTALSLNPGLANSMDTNTSTVSLNPDAALSVDTCSVVDGLPRPRTS